MVAVYKNHGFKWFAVMVFTLSRLKTDACGETRFAAGRFTVPEKSLRFYYGPVLQIQVKSAGRFRSGLHSTTSLFQNCDASHAYTVSPAADSSCVDCTSWTHHWLNISCCAAITSLYFKTSRRHPWFDFRNTIGSTLNGHAYLPARCQSEQTGNKRCAPLCSWSPTSRALYS